MFYLRWPDNYKEVLEYESTEMREEFANSIKCLEYKRYDDITDSWIYLYAYTTDKKFAKWFYNIHDKNLFVMKKKEMTKSEYTQFYSDNVFSRLEKFNYDETKDDEYFPATRLEISSLENDLPIIIQADLASHTFPYLIFNDEIVEELDAILFCTLYDINFNEDVDFYSYQWGSFGIPSVYPAEKQVNIRYNYKNLYLDYFKPILDKGDDE